MFLRYNSFGGRESAASRVTLLLLLILLPVFALAQDIVRLTGRVVSKQSGEPLIGVNISDAQLRRALAVTDEDGRFALDTHVGTTLKFSMVGAKPETIKVKNGKYIEVKLNEEDISLGEIVVSTKRITDKIMPEPTDIEIKGNYFYVRTRVRVPREMFSHDTRLVVQPVLNNATRGELSLMRPMVYDAREYHQTQDRLYTFDMNDSIQGDPLARYITVKSPSTKEAGRTNDIIGYSDSIYVTNVRDEYSCDVYMAIENYNRILYRDTTIIARGTVNPLRWLDYSFAARQLNDSSYYSQPEKQLRDTHGEIDLRFPIGKARFDTSNPHNAAEIAHLGEQADAVGKTKDATLQSLSLEGVSSPDGRYSRNATLARQRMDFALGYIRSHLPSDLTKNMQFTSKSSVATWSDVVALLRRDSLNAEADRMQQIIDRNSSADRQGALMRTLPFYTSVLEKKYLPQLRHVSYTLNYSIFRQLTLDEIRQLYASDPRQLSRFEYFQLYRGESDPAAREKELRHAVEQYPSFLCAANDLAAQLINDHHSDPALLRPFAGAKAPAVVNANQMIALLDAGQYTAADSLESYVGNGDDTRLLRAVNGVLNGRYADNFDIVASTGTRNRLLMLLALKRNDEALALSRQLPDGEALTHYLRAICLNRKDDAVGAYDELKRSFEMDPSLKNVAKIDGDVCDLLMEHKNK